MESFAQQKGKLGLLLSSISSYGHLPHTVSSVCLYSKHYVNTCSQSQVISTVCMQRFLPNAEEQRHKNSILFLSLFLIATYKQLPSSQLSWVSSSSPITGCTHSNNKEH